MAIVPEVLFETKSIVGEGPIWDQDNKVLYWIDIMGKELHTHVPATGSHDVKHLPKMVGTVVCRASGTLVLALEDGFYDYDPKTDTLTLIVEVEAELPANRFNDGKCDPAGRLWCGTMRIEEGGTDGSMYRLDADHSVHKMFSDVAISNGICWSADAKTMYYVDTPTMKIDAFDYDNVTGEIENRRLCCQVTENEAWPDGMVIDEEGMLWVGHYFGRHMRRWDPNSGKCIDKIEMPCSNITGCAFGGDNLEVMYITSATHALDDAQKAAEPLAGSLFVADAGVRGTTTPKYIG